MSLHTSAPAIPLPATVAAADRRLLRNDVYELLLEHIIAGTFQPGERLKDAELTDWLGVSRTPVREALSRLAAVGLIRTAPNRYTLVAPISVPEIVGALAVLRRLYPDVMTDALAHLDADADVRLELLAARLERDDEAGVVEAFRRLMTVLLGAARNRVLAEAVETVHLRVIRYVAIAPAAEGVLNREGVVALARAAAERDGRAVAMLEELLDEVVRTLP